MRLNVYFSGCADSGNPWMSRSKCDDVYGNEHALNHVRSLSNGCPVFRVTVEVPDEVLAMPPVLVGDDVVAEAVEPLSVAA